MLNLAEYRKKPRMLADYLPWAALVAPGLVLNKDGSFQRTARFRGPDLDSATPAELVGTWARLNNALRRLGSGWAIFVEASRVAAQRYPQSRFPDPVSNLVDSERRAQFEEARAASIPASSSMVSSTAPTAYSSLSRDSCRSLRGSPTRRP
jgi:type IV secretion system protein VirB4